MAKPNILFNINFDAIANIQKFISENAKIKIGVLANEQRDDSHFGSVELACVHEFGSIIRGIPQRSFLRQTMINRKDDFKAEIDANKYTIGKRIAAGNGDKVLEKMGATWLRYVLETFDNEGPGWLGLKKATVARRIKKSDKPLQDTGEMKKSITFMVAK